MTRDEFRARNLEILRRWGAGEKVADIAVAFGLSPRRVEHIVAGVTRPRVRKARAARARSPEALALRERIVELYAQGTSHRDIAAELGINVSYSSKVCREAGLSRAAGASPRTSRA